MKKTIFFVGISYKNGKNGEILEAFSSDTNSGKILDKLEKCLEGVEIYKTNLVDFVPLDEKNKLRYPNKIEMQKGLNILEKKIIELSPKIIVLFGKNVYDFVITKTNLDKNIFIYAYHPSYIAVYKRKQEQEYINDLCQKIKK